MGLSFTSLLFETVNFLILVWVLSRFVYRPLKKSLAERRAADERLRVEAEAKRDEATRALEEMREKHKELGELRERVMREAAEDAAAMRARLLAEAKDDTAAARAQGERLLDSEREEARAAVRDLAIRESTHIAARLLAELSPRALDDALVEQLARAVPEHDLRRDGAGRRVSEIELRFARPPAPEAVTRLRKAFADALDADPTIATRQDPALVAGVVATIGEHVLDASIAGNLTALAARARALSEGEGEGATDG
ncbi:MAG: F0F1 ATP synthase subunit delta [Labilithrix sp.]|nr:F0F1 ATP synthase subunit delta [Labilithrix sp.]MCW5812576.1 F0F1 ATP synthase subunit delta [Labilithrix sp.]